MKRKIFIISLLLLSSNFLLSQTKQYSLEDAIRTALENNYETKSRLLEITKAQAAVSEAYGYALPSVDFKTGFNHFLETPKIPFPNFQSMLTNATYSILFDENVLPRDNSKYMPMTTTLQSFTQANSYEAAVQFSQILFNSAVLEGIGASGTYLQTSKVALKANIASTVNAVRKSFYTVILAKQLLEITNASFENAKKNLASVKALEKQGLVSEFDALQAEVQVENIHPIVLQIENTLKMAKESFKLTLGLPQNEDIDVLGELTFSDGQVPDVSEAVNQAMGSNYDILTLENKQKVDNAFVEITRSEYWPTLVAFGSYSLNGTSNNLKFQNYRSAMIGISLNINLFSGMRTKNKVEQSLIDVEKTEMQINQLRHAIALQVKNQINELERIKSNVEAQERNVRLAEKSYELSTIRYREGTGNQLEIQNADLALRQARTNLLNSYYDFTTARSELETLIGNVDGKYFEVYSKYLDNKD